MPVGKYRKIGLSGIIRRKDMNNQIKKDAIADLQTVRSELAGLSRRIDSTTTEGRAQLQDIAIADERVAAAIKRVTWLEVR
jgi:hypothetical protein